MARAASCSISDRASATSSPPTRRQLLRDIRNQLAPGDMLLLGVDMVKDIPTLIAAYDDARGVTAAFNRNVLARINRELGADFDLMKFRHKVRWNGEHSRIEMHLESLHGARGLHPVARSLARPSAAAKPSIPKTATSSPSKARSTCWRRPASPSSNTGPIHIAGSASSSPASIKQTALVVGTDRVPHPGEIRMGQLAGSRPFG